MDQQTVNWLIQGKEIIAIVTLAWLIIHTYRVIIPDLLTKKDKDLADVIETLSRTMAKVASVLEEVRANLIYREDHYQQIRDELMSLHNAEKSESGKVDLKKSREISKG